MKDLLSLTFLVLLAEDYLESGLAAGAGVKCLEAPESRLLVLF